MVSSRCARARANRARVELRLHSGAGVRQYRELGAFVRYCVSRIEREFGQIEHWAVTITPSRGGFASRVAIADSDDPSDGPLESTGHGMDGPLAAWDALCKFEQRLRERRAQRTTGSPGDGGVRDRSGDRDRVGNDLRGHAHG